MSSIRDNMSLARRLIRKLRVGKEKYFVGNDLEGNAFYERPSLEDPSDWRHSKRSIEYVEERPLSEYRFQSIPVQWSAWMRRTRRDPPTLDELRIDAARQERLKDNVERLRLAYVEEKERLRIGNEQLLRIGEAAAAGAEGPEPVQQQQQGAVAMQAHANTERVGPSGSEASEATGAATTQPTTGTLGDSSVAAKAMKQREEEREAAKQRREEFARQNPTFGGKGNPGDTAQPDTWQPGAAPRRR